MALDTESDSRITFFFLDVQSLIYLRTLLPFPRPPPDPILWDFGSQCFFFPFWTPLASITFWFAPLQYFHVSLGGVFFFRLSFTLPPPPVLRLGFFFFFLGLGTPSCPTALDPLLICTIFLFPIHPGISFSLFLTTNRFSPLFPPEVVVLLKAAVERFKTLPLGPPSLVVNDRSPHFFFSGGCLTWFC